MPKVHYIAYGSNLHPVRLVARVPSARAVDVVEMRGHRLAFDKRSTDGSAKCHVYTEEADHHTVYGALYEFDARHKPRLDAAEGGGYRERIARVPLNGNGYRPYTYVARQSHIEPDLLPYHWYKSLVLAGARFHGFPEHYIATIEAAPSTHDPDQERVRRHERLLEDMAGR